MVSRQAKGALAFATAVALAFVLWYFVFRDTREEGDACEMEESDDEDPHGVTYELDEDLECKVASCETGYSIKDGEDMCTEISGGGGGGDGGGGGGVEPCTQAQQDAITDSRAIVTGVTNGQCRIRSCIPGWSPSSDGQSCAFNSVGDDCYTGSILYGTFDATGTCVESECEIGADHAIYSGADCTTFVDCAPGYVKNSSDNCVFNINQKIADVTDLFIRANDTLDGIETSIREEDIINMDNLKTGSFDTIEFGALQQLYSDTNAQITQYTGTVDIEGQGEMSRQRERVTDRQNWRYFEDIYNAKQSGLTNFSSSKRCSADTTIPKSIYSFFESTPRNEKITPGAGQTCQGIFRNRASIPRNFAYTPPIGYNVLANEDCELIYGKRFTSESLTRFEFDDGIVGESCHIPTKLVNMFNLCDGESTFEIATNEDDKGTMVVVGDDVPVHTRFKLKLKQTCFPSIGNNLRYQFYFRCTYDLGVSKERTNEFLLHTTPQLTDYLNTYDINFCKKTIYTRKPNSKIGYMYPIFTNDFRNITNITSMEIVIRLSQSNDDGTYYYYHDEETINLLEPSSKMNKIQAVGGTAIAFDLPLEYDENIIPLKDDWFNYKNTKKSIIKFGVSTFLANFVNTITNKFVYLVVDNIYYYFLSYGILKVEGSETYSLQSSYPSRFTYSDIRAAVYNSDNDLLHVFLKNGDVVTYKDRSFTNYVKTENIQDHWKFPDRSSLDKLNAIYFDTYDQYGYYFFLNDNTYWYKRYGSSYTPDNRGSITGLASEFSGLISRGKQIYNVSRDTYNSYFYLHTNDFITGAAGFGQYSGIYILKFSNNNLSRSIYTNVKLLPFKKYE